VQDCAAAAINAEPAVRITIRMMAKELRLRLSRFRELFNKASATNTQLPS
jgi:hypothetical protein